MRDLEAKPLAAEREEKANEILRLQNLSKDVEEIVENR